MCSECIFISALIFLLLYMNVWPFDNTAYTCFCLRWKSRHHIQADPNFTDFLPQFKRLVLRGEGEVRQTYNLFFQIVSQLFQTTESVMCIPHELLFEKNKFYLH